MLISSHRHKPEDLELWAELEAADRIHYEVGRVAEKAAHAVLTIKAFAWRREGRCYVGVSGGKDSAVTASLARCAGVECPLLFIRAIPHENPDTPKVLSCIGGVRIVDADYRHIPASASKWESEREKDRVFFDVCARLGRQCGSRILGIRAVESRARQLRIGRWGLETDNALAPIGRWSTADVFAYAAVHHVPLHPAYAMLGGGRWDRERLRVDELGGERGDGSGRAEWEREYYGDVLRRLEAGKS